MPRHFTVRYHYHMYMYVPKAIEPTYKYYISTNMHRTSLDPTSRPYGS